MQYMPRLPAVALGNRRQAQLLQRRYPAARAVGRNIFLLFFIAVLGVFLGPGPEGSLPDSMGNPAVAPGHGSQVPGEVAVLAFATLLRSRQHIEAIVVHATGEWPTRLTRRQESQPPGKPVIRQGRDRQRRHMQFWQVLHPELPAPAGTSHHALDGTLH